MIELRRNTTNEQERGWQFYDKEMVGLSCKSGEFDFCIGLQKKLIYIESIIIMDSNFILVNRTIIKFIYNLDGRQQEERN